MQNSHIPIAGYKLGVLEKESLLSENCYSLLKIMERFGTDVDFLEDLSPLSQALIQSIYPPPAYATIPSGSFVVITSAICFKPFETRFLAGLGEANLSRTLEQIRETSVFRNLTSIASDNSDTIPLDIRKKEFFLGKSNNLKLMLEYCILSKLELEESGEELDESDLMIVGYFNCIMEFYKREKNYQDLR